MSVEDRLVADLPGAIAHGEIRTYFQPQVDLQNGQVAVVEALSRWRHPILGAVSPDVFVPLAEASGCIHELGLHVMKQCCRHGALWRENGVHVRVAVNVSPLQLARSSFGQELQSELEKSALAPADLILEITESEPIAEPERALAQLDGARAQGVVVSIDDFGKGHSSTERALLLHATELKIDRSVVAAAEQEPLELAVRFAQDHGMCTVAEGVESREQLHRVTRLGCDRVQGFLIAQPAPPLQFARWMAAYTAP